MFLVATLKDEVIETPAQPSTSTIQAGSRIKIIELHGPDGQRALPLFSDWQAIGAWFDEQRISTMVLPAVDAWSFAGRFDEAVINPAGPTLTLNTEQTAELARLSASE